MKSTNETPLTRRLRRLDELKRDDQLAKVNKALRQIWEPTGGPRPDPILLRPHFLLAVGDGPDRRAAPMSRLLTSRGIALRFYLLAIFEAQCRLQPRDPWTNIRLLSGHMGWRDLIAIDAAYNHPTKTYLHNSVQNRTSNSSIDRQIKGALRTLEELEDQALVVVPRKANERHRNYSAFELMHESGRGGVPTPNSYTVPRRKRGVIDIPREFFLHGWVQVLYPSEIATWLTLRFLRSCFPRRHDESGVFLYGQTREEYFHLLRDTYEDGCQTLLRLGLIRPAQPMSPTIGGEPEAPDTASPFGILTELLEVDEHDRVRYQPNRYQLTDDGLNQDAFSVSTKEFRLLRKEKELS